MEEIYNDPKLNHWFETFDLKANTKDSYTRVMSKFCECVGKTPSELIDEAVNERRKGLLPSECKTGIYIVKFKKLLKRNNAAPTSIASALATIKSFYNAFDIVLPAALCRVKRALPLEENMNFLKKEDVHNLIINAASLRDKAIILLMATSGMARNEIINLRIKNITFDESGVGIIRVRRQKTQVDYTTFCSPEATQAIKAYLDERNRIPQHVTHRRWMPVDKLCVKGDDDYIFKDYQYAKKLNPDAFNSIFRRHADKLNYYNGKGNYRKSRSHALRKFFASTLENAGMPKPKVDFMLGHYRSGGDIAYFNVDIALLKQLYIDYLQYLTFEKEIHIHSVKTEDEKRLADVEERNKQLKAQVDNMQAVLNEILSAAKGNKALSLSFDRKEEAIHVIDHREGDNYIVKSSYKKPKTAND